MEHMLWPSNSTEVPQAVPCVCEPPYYGGNAGTFLDYPEMSNKNWLKPQSDLSAFIRTIGSHRIQHSPAVKELQRFYQSWLFFGLIKEALGNDFRAQDFVFENKVSRWITTRKLPEKLYSRFQAAPPSEADRAHFQRCLNAAAGVLSSTQYRINISEKSQSQDLFDWKVMFCIASTAELIAHTIGHRLMILKREHVEIIFPSGSVSFPSKPIEEKMKMANWCVSELQSMQTKFKSLFALFALSRLDKTALHRSHNDCQEGGCTHYQIDKDTYIPKHVDDDDCEFFESERLNKDVEDILNGDDNTFPVLNTKLEVVKATAEIPYVAISHVWADGMGNPKANSLPRCNFQYIIQLVRNLVDKTELQQKQAADNQGEMHLWIDTLCCPWGESTARMKTARMNAISRLRDTYRGAGHVLVLDAGLRSIQLNSIPAWEVFLHIFTSGWVSRLWTLQEAILSNSLWFQFKDQAESLVVLKRRLNEEAAVSTRVWNLRKSLAGEFSWLDTLISPTPNTAPGGPSNIALRTLIRALAHRSVSKAADEPLCLCTILGISLDDLQMEELRAVQNHSLEERRMSAFWKLFEQKFGGIPIALLLLRYPKLREPPFLWAPRTLLETADHDCLHYTTVEIIGRITERGVSFRSSGFIIRKKAWHDGLSNNPWKQLGPQFEDFTAATFREPSSGKYFIFANTFDRDGLPSFRRGSKAARSAFAGASAYAIIPMPSFTNIQTSETALLGIFDEQAGIVRHAFRVGFIEYEESRSLVLRTAEEMAHRARKEPFAMELDQGEKGTPAFANAGQQLEKFLIAEAEDRLKNEEVKNALVRNHRTDKPLRLGRMAYNWFWNDYVGESLGPGTEWIID